MKIDLSVSAPLEALSETARAGEADGYDGLWVGETNHDPFLQALTSILGGCSP